MNQGKAEHDDVDVLFPERVLIIGGEHITVHEISFIQGLQLGHKVEPMINRLAELFTEDAVDIDYNDIALAFANHADVLAEMISITTGKPAEWVNDLNDADGQALMSTLWVVNRDFFTRRLTGKKLMAHLRKARAEHAASDSVSSTPH